MHTMSKIYKRVTINLDEEAFGVLEIIRKKYFMSTASDAMKFCLAMAQENMANLGEARGNNPQGKVGRPPITEAELVKRKTLSYEDKKTIVAKAKQDEQIKMAEAPYPDGLAGKVSEDKKTVKYWKYFDRGRDENIILLREVSKELIEWQHQPSYKEIMRMQQAGYVDYPVEK